MVLKKLTNYFKRKKDFVTTYKNSYYTLEEEWGIFIPQNTYLVFSHKQKFLTAINNLLKFSIRSWLKRRKIKNEREKATNLKHLVEEYNTKFILQRLQEHEIFFSGEQDSLGYSLSEEQRLAIIKDDQHNLVVAGAGSGKTSVLTSRVVYLTRRKDKVDKEKILALAFNKNAVIEMEKRLRNVYKTDTEISTFHSLGFTIIHQETKKRPRVLFDGDAFKQRELITSLFQKELQDRPYQKVFLTYLAFHSQPEVKRESFERKKEYFKYMRSLRYRTLNGINVKSISERDIGNFLFMNQIKFIYEPFVEWVTKDDKDKDYRPDFYLPEYKIYIEHWGLNREHKVPQWFTQTSEEYLQKREWKLTQFRIHQKILVETWDYERIEGSLLPNLQNKLAAISPLIEFIPLTYEELVRKTNDFRGHKNEISKLITSFIRTAKCNFYTIAEIEKKVSSKQYSKKQQVFGRLVIAVFKKYQEHLTTEGKIDFNDMINMAVNLVKNNPENYLNQYDHILVDEFQDISHQRKELLRGFVNQQSNTKLFCVGDDWQSIYQFNGSDVDLFVNFERSFPHPEINFLETNYRSTSTIVDMSNQLIGNNKNQFKKIMRSHHQEVSKITVFEFAESFLYNFRARLTNVVGFIQSLLTKNIKPSEIMVISRFRNNLKELEIMCGAEGIPTEVRRGGIRFCTAHSSKGLEANHVIILDVNSGLYGFPCEIQDSSVLEIAKRYKIRGFIQEERRLFYVALTRSKEHIYIYTVQGHNSVFLDEIKNYVTREFIEQTDHQQIEQAVKESGQQTLDSYTNTISPQNHLIYILKLKDDNWYVGKTANLDKEIERIIKGNGPAWTQMHEMETVIKLIEGGDLKQITLAYMKKYGWQKVRGYAWSQRDMRNPPKELRGFVSNLPLQLAYMKKYGWQKVRGYAWSQRDMRNPPKELRGL